MADADVVLLGEIHDNPIHHENQAQWVYDVQPAAIVFEMLSPEQAAMITGVTRADVNALAMALDWEGSGWPQFAWYHQIMMAAPDAVILGGAVARADVRAAIGQGAAALAGDAARFGLDQPLPQAEQAAREAEQLAAHCDALPADMLPGFVEAQRLRDAGLARAVLAASTHPVVVITGNGHARRDWGVPALLAIADPSLKVFTIGQFEADPGPDAPFDRIVITEPTERDDPCAAFRD